MNSITKFEKKKREQTLAKTMAIKELISRTYKSVMSVKISQVIKELNLTGKDDVPFNDFVDYLTIEYANQNLDNHDFVDKLSSVIGDNDGNVFVNTDNLYSFSDYVFNNVTVKELQELVDNFDLKKFRAGNALEGYRVLSSSIMGEEMVYSSKGVDE